MWRELGAQLRSPSGWLGRGAGAFMRLVNRGPNAAALSALNLRRGDDVLELGFGPGEAMRALARLSPDGMIWGVDHSTVMLAQARRRNARAVDLGRMRLRVGVFERLPVPDRAVDKVLAVNVAYFWDDPDAVMGEIWRVLRPGGRVSVYVTDKSVMRSWRFAGHETHRLYDAASLAKLLGRKPFDARHVRLLKTRLPFGLAGLVAIIDKPR